MLGPIGHVGSGLAYLASARRRQASDLVTQRQIAMQTSPLPAGLTLAWYGAAGFRLAYQGTVLWIDPYVTRLPLAAWVRRRVIRTDDAEVARRIDRADAILVGHTHFDHAMDVPAIARRTGARVFGSDSCAHLMRLFGLSSVVVEPHRGYEVGPFRFRFVPSVHSKLQLGLGVPADGELTCEHLDGLTPQAYRCGQVWGIAIEVGGAKLYHQGSADLLDDEVRDRGVDVFLCGIAGRRFTPRFLERACKALDPKLIVPTHYDDFFRPAGAPMRTSFNVNLTGFADEAAAVRVPLAALSLQP